MSGKLWRRIYGALVTFILILPCIQLSESLGEPESETASPNAELVAMQSIESSPTGAVTTVPPIASTTPDVSSTPEASATSIPDTMNASPTPEASVTPFPEDTAPPCDIPDCPHVTVDENGNTVAVCLLGQWMLAHPETTSEPVAETLLLSAAAAQASSTNSVLSGGDIQFSDFSGVVLDGTSQTTTATWSISNIIDTRGTDSGWNVSLTLTQFKEWSGNEYVAYGDTLRPSSMTVTSIPVVNPADETSSSADQIRVVGAATALDTGTPVTLLSCGDGQGMGSFTVSNMTVTLVLPANVYAHTYKTDATVALVSGP